MVVLGVDQVIPTKRSDKDIYNIGEGECQNLLK